MSEEAPASLSAQDLISDFAQEIGTLRGQMIVDSRIRQVEKESWDKERQDLHATITSLADRLMALEQAAEGAPEESQAAPEPPAKDPARRLPKG